MKNKLILGAALLMAAVTETLACTNFIVGKKCIDRRFGYCILFSRFIRNVR